MRPPKIRHTDAGAGAEWRKNMIRSISGGVCAAKGFTANGILCGIRKGRTKNDLSLIVSSVPAAAAAVYTQNKVKGAPLTVTKQHISDGKAQAVLANSGNANTCNANGIEIAEAMCRLVADGTGISENDVVVASTGVIGQVLSIDPIAKAMPALIAGLSEEGSDAAAQGIMTTDTVKKELAVEFTAGGRICRLGGIAKGSGMIHPNMATMLVFLTSDIAISPALLQKALSEEIAASFNMLSIDGDTSTNDMVTVLANGLAGNPEITEENEDYLAFAEALHAVTSSLCRMLAKDGEGATKLLVCTVTGADTLTDARIAAKSVISSSLLKAAMFGADANWGRILCAVGYSGAAVDPGQVDVSFRSAKGEIAVCEKGAGIPFSEEKAKEILSEDEIDILISAGNGAFSATAWGCDLTYDYVKINGDYRT